MNQTKKTILSNHARYWTMWVLANIFYCYENFLQVSLDVMHDDLRQAFHLTASGFGHLGAWYFYAYALMQIPVGLLLDRYSIRRLLSCAILICAIGCAIFGQAHVFWQACLGRLLIGLGSAFAALSCLQIAASYLPKKRFAMLTGLTLTLGMLGAVIAQVPLAWLIDIMSWRQTMMTLALIGFGLTFLVWVLFIKHRAHHDLHMPTSWLNQLLKVIQRPQIWLVAMYGGLVFLSTPVFGGLWGAAYLRTVLKVSENYAAYMIQFLFIGWAVGAPIFGWASDQLGRRLPALYVSVIGTFLAYLAIVITLPIPIMGYCVILFMAGFFTSGFLPAFSIIRDISAHQQTATGLGFMNSMNMIGPAIVNPLIGYVLDQQWHGQMAHGIRIYSVGAYQQAMWIIPITLLLAFITLPFIKETYCRLVGQSIH